MTSGDRARPRRRFGRLIAGCSCLLFATGAAAPETRDMALVPAGEFIMGDPAAGPTALPVRRVYLDAYWIDKFEVTNAQFATFLNAKNADRFDEQMEIEPGPDGTYGAEAGRERFPVRYVDWHGAAGFCRWAGKRLPTEAEWEKAARGTDGRPFPWGDAIDGSRANFLSSGDPYDEGTTPVGFYDGKNPGTQDSPSPYGVYDLAGNVGEWVADWYAPDAYQTGPSRNPTGPAAGQARSGRGASWQHPPELLRSTMRYSGRPDARYDYVGFRCARDGGQMARLFQQRFS